MAITFNTQVSQVRIDAILEALSEGPMTTIQIAGAADCSETTVRRYIPYLTGEVKLVRECAFVDGKQAYALRDGFEIAPRVTGGRIYSQFARHDVPQPVIRRDPMVAAFFGGV
jgi:hypothetical protein